MTVELSQRQGGRTKRPDSVRARRAEPKGKSTLEPTDARWWTFGLPPRAGAEERGGGRWEDSERVTLTLEALNQPSSSRAAVRVNT